MNPKLLLLIVTAALFSSCSTTYRSGQTPDDVYYSPAREVEENYQVRTEDKKRPEVYYDRSIRMAVYDRRWRYWNDEFDYYYDPYHYGYSYGYYYNPYYCHYPVYITNVTIRDPKNHTPRMTYLGSYANSNYKVSNFKTSNMNWNVPTRSYYNNSNSSTVTRQRYSNRNDSETQGNSRSYNPSSSSGSSSGSRSGSSSSGTSVSRPGRGN